MFASKLTNSVGIDQFREAAQHLQGQALFESLSEPAMNTKSVKNFSCIPTTLLICFVLLSGCRISSGGPPNGPSSGRKNSLWRLQT